MTITKANAWGAVMNVVVAMSVLIGGAFGLFFLMEQRHESSVNAESQRAVNALALEQVRKENEEDRVENERERLKIRGEILTTEIGSDNRIRDHYENLSQEKTLNKAETQRVKNLERRLERSYKAQEKNEEYVHELGKEG